MLHSLDIDVVNPQRRPIKPFFEIRQGDWVDSLMHLCHPQYRVFLVNIINVIDDFGNRGFCAAQIQSSDLIQCIPPRGSYIHDDKIICGESMIS